MPSRPDDRFAHSCNQLETGYKRHLHPFKYPAQRKTNPQSCFSSSHLYLPPSSLPAPPLRSDAADGEVTGTGMPSGKRARISVVILGRQRVDHGHVGKERGYRQFGTMEYAFFGSDEANLYENCWHATQRLISECADTHHGAGSWKENGEFYGMSATSSGVYKRDIEDSDGNSTLTMIPGSTVFANATSDASNLPSLPPTLKGSLANLRLSSGTYSVRGHPVSISVSGINLDGSQHLTRDDGINLDTNYGQQGNFSTEHSPDVDLEAAILGVLDELDIQQRQSSKRHHARDATNDCWASGSYVMPGAGRWWQEWKPASSCRRGCGRASTGCSASFQYGETITEQFSVGLSGNLAATIGQVALSLSYKWTRSYTQSTIETCHWWEGGGRILSIQQPMF